MNLPRWLARGPSMSLLLLVGCYVAAYGPPPTDTAVDADGDGFFADADCDDSNGSVYPGAHLIEVPGDGIDADCDGLDRCTDLNCDGWPDLAFARLCAYDDATQRCAADDHTGGAVVFYGGEDGVGEGSAAALALDDTSDVAVGDLNADGYLDVVAVAGAADTLESRVFWGSGAGLSAETSSSLPITDGAAAHAADLDGDGADDLIVLRRPAGVDIYWGAAGGGTALSGPTHRDDTFQSVDAGDIDADGHVDLALAGAVSGVIWGDGTRESFASAAVTTISPPYALGVTIGDVDCDGHDDLTLAGVFYSEHPPPADALAVLGGAGGRQWRTANTMDLLGAYRAVLADLDVDGVPDVVTAQNLEGEGEPATSASVLWGPWSPTGSRTAYAVSSAFGVAVADVDADGAPDLAFANYSADESSLYYGALRNGAPARLVTGMTVGVVAAPAAGRGCEVAP